MERLENKMHYCNTRQEKMIKEYRVWNDGSSQEFYIIADTPKKAVIEFTRGSIYLVDYPIHAILWKKGKELHSLKITEVAIKFRDYRGIDKYYKYGKKYNKSDLKEAKNNGKVTLD